MRQEALVIGGGLAGATVAARLAEAGRTVLLVEKSAGAHDKVCGDFLSQEALHYLRRMEMDPAGLGGVALHAVRVARREVIAEADLPFQAMSLRRRVLDEALLKRASAAGTTVLRGARVEGVERAVRGFAAGLGEAGSAEADTLFLATGKHDLQGHARRGGWQNGLVGLKMYYRLSAAQTRELAGHVELILFPGGYAGLQPVDAGLANLCLLLTKEQLRRCGAKWEEVLDLMCGHSEHLARRLSGAEAMLNKPLALSSIPYGFLAREAEAGFWRVGDQAAVIPSFSGDGMSIALHSAHLAAEMYLAGESSTAFARRLSGQLRAGVTLATGVSQALVRMPSVSQLTGWTPALLRSIAVATRVPAEVLLQTG